MEVCDPPDSTQRNAPFVALLNLEIELGYTRRGRKDVLLCVPSFRLETRGIHHVLRQAVQQEILAYTQSYSRTT